MAKERCLVGELEAANLGAAPPDLKDHFHHVVDVRLRINAARNREPQQILGPGMLDAVFVAFAEHQGADFHGADPAFDVEFGGEGDAGKLRGGNVREKGTRVDVDGMAARRLHDGHASAAM